MSAEASIRREATAAAPRWAALLVFMAAVTGRLPALGAWWCRDDWGLLARASGQIAADPGLPARWLSQHLYWNLTWPLWGLHSLPHAVIRLALHGLAAVLVLRLGRRAGLGVTGAVVAGLLFGATPLAFLPLYWASGIQELLAAVLALLATDLWLSGRERGRRALGLATLAALAAMLAKETGLGLPLLFLIFLWLGWGVRLEDKAFAWAMVMLLLAAAVGTGVLALQHFATAAGEPYDLGGLRVAAVNLGGFGWWLLSPGPLLAGRMVWPQLVAGGTFFGLWLLWAAARWRTGERLPLVALVAALLVLAPALPLRQHVAPYLAYLAAAPWCLALATLLPRGMATRGLWLLTAAVLAAAWAYLGMHTRLTQRNALGMPADDLVAATSLSWDACRTLRQAERLLGDDDLKHVVLLQLPAGADAADRTARFGEHWTVRSDLYVALAGTVGPRLVLLHEVTVSWASGLVSAPQDALVLVDAGTGLRPWGRTGQAVLYAALTEVGLGHHAAARRHLRRAGQLHDDHVAFVYDAGQMVVPLSLVMQRKEEFIDWTLTLLEAGASPVEVGGLQEMFFNLLSSCSGRSMDELTAGSRLLSGEKRPAADPNE